MLEIKTILTKDLSVALKQKDKPAIKAIRNLRARIDNAEAVAVPESLISQQKVNNPEASSQTEVPRKELSEEDIRGIIQKEISDTKEALYFLEKYSKPDDDNLADQIAFLEKYNV